MSRALPRTAALLAAAAAVLLHANVQAENLRVLTTGILKGSFTKIATQFEKDTGHKVTMSWGPSSGNSPEASPVRVRNGEAVDVLIMVDNGMDGLIKSGHFTPTFRTNVAVSKIGVAVKAGAFTPDISTPEALKRALLDAKSIGYSEGASGTYVSTVLLQRLGIEKDVASKSHVVLGRKFVGEVVASGEVELGIQQLSELRLEPGLTVLGPLPDALQKVSVVAAAVSSKAQAADAARQFVDYLSTPYAQQAIRDSGLDLP